MVGREDNEVGVTQGEYGIAWCARLIERRAWTMEGFER